MKILYSLLLIFCFVGCDSQPTPQVSTKTVIAKEAPIETFNGSRPYTVHYLIAEDGSTLKVTVGWYGKTKIGDKVSGHWE